MPAMAESTTTNRTTGSTRKPAARKSTTRRSANTNRRTTTTRRSTAAKSPSKSPGRRARTVARNETRDAAQAQVRAAQTTAAQGRNVAERAALAYIGATLEARDRVLDLVGRFGSLPSAEREVKKFERRGERDVKKARTQVERLVRTRRRDAERLVRRNQRAVQREVGAAERQADRRSNIVTARIADVSNRVEDAAQFGVATGSRIASAARGRVSTLV
jgi:hypothetical protein